MMGILKVQGLMDMLTVVQLELNFKNGFTHLYNYTPKLMYATIKTLLKIRNTIMDHDFS